MFLCVLQASIGADMKNLQFFFFLKICRNECKDPNMVTKNMLPKHAKTTFLQFCLYLRNKLYVEVNSMSDGTQVKENKWPPTVQDETVTQQVVGVILCIVIKLYFYFTNHIIRQYKTKPDCVCGWQYHRICEAAFNSPNLWIQLILSSH